MKGDQTNTSKDEKKKISKVKYSRPKLSPQLLDKHKSTSVIRTKVSRFHVTPKPSKVQIIDSITEDNVVNNAATSMDGEDHCSNDYKSDFDMAMGQLLLSNFSEDSEFWTLGQFDNGGSGAGDSDYNEVVGTKGWLSSDYQPLLFTDEMVKDWIRDDC